MCKRVLPLLAVFALLFAAGCGDDSESADTDETTEPTEAPAETTTTTEEEEEALSLEDWAAEADEICEEFDDATEDLPSDTADEIGESLPEVIELFEEQIEELEALGAPEEEADTVEEALELLGDQIDLLNEANDAIEDGTDPEEAFIDINDEGIELEEQTDELAEELGLEVCGGEDESTDETTVDTSETEFGAYGSDPELDALYDDCADGSAEACDDLWDAAEVGTEYYDFGYSCGGVVPEGETEICSEALGGGGDDGGTAEADSYGDDEALDALWDACEDGDGQACDDLFFDSPVGSEYEEFGKTCGGRLEGLDAETEYCVDAI